MKFLCEQCKAKYQIADDKVAGKTVRMKCRKCGHMIEVRAEVTETSVAKGLPEQDSKKAPAAGARTATLKSGLATSLTARPPPPKGKPDALAGAFQKKVRQDQAVESTASLEMLDSNASNGWYVAINGVPVGPIRVSELRRKAANGAITEDSLVWREGLEEWRPVRSVTEIAEIVRESLMSGRPSLATPPPGEMRSSAPPPAPSISPRPAPRPPAPLAPRAPMAPSPSPSLGARSNVVPFTGRLATAEKLEEAEDIDIDEDLEPISASAAAAIAAPAGATPGPLAERPSLIAADPFAVPGAALPSYAPQQYATTTPLGTPNQQAAVASIAMSPPVLVTESGAKKPPNWIAIGMVGAFVAFGGMSAVFIFKKDPPQQQPQVIIVPQQTQPAVAIAPTTPTEAPVAATTPESTPGKPSTKGSSAGQRQPSGTQNTAKPLEGLGTLVDPKGPNVGVNPGSARPSSAALTSDQVESTVRNYSTGVKRTCWDRIGVSTPSVNVNAKVGVTSSGQVSSVDASGNDPVVAKCIENQVKGWHFPASGESTTVNIPFKFVRQ